MPLIALRYGLSTYTAHGPEKITVLVFINRQEVSTRRDHLHLEDIVSREPVSRREDFDCQPDETAQTAWKSSPAAKLTRVPTASDVAAESY